MKIKNNIMEIMLLIGVLALLFHSNDPIMHNDSPRYINGSLIDPPIFYTVITIMLSLFGTLKSVIVLQTLFVGFSIAYFTKTMSDIFNLDNLIKILISLFLFLPIIKFYDSILTETLGYAFSLLFVSFVVKLICNFNSQNLFWSTVFVVALLLLRKQFVFLYPLILILYLGIFILNKSKKTFTWLTICFLSIFLIPSSLISLNNYANLNSSDKKIYQDLDGYGPFYFTYIDSIYISTTKDAKLFENQNVRKTLTKIFEEMNNQRALVKYYDGRGHFGLSFAAIRNHSHSQLINLASQENTTVSDLKKKISVTLISANFGKYVKQIFKKFYDSTWLFVFIPFFMLLAGLICFLKNKSHFSLITIFISTFTLGNHSIVYLFGRVQPRYLIYSDFILLVFIFILFSVFLQKKNEI
jgi:hypothetical protein